MGSHFLARIYRVTDIRLNFIGQLDTGQTPLGNRPNFLSFRCSQLDPYSGAVAAGVISGFIAYLNGFLSTFLLAVAFSFIGPLVVVALIVMFSIFMNMINEMLIAMATTGCAAARGGR